MKLLQEKDLIWSPVVANCNMNRKRNLLGINSYEKDIGFNIIDFLKERTALKKEKINWMDLCCGEGKAVIQAAQIFEELNLNKKITIEGLDLTDHFVEKNNNVNLIANSVLSWAPDKKYDLITCVHGLHYIGDKLTVIEKCVQALKPDGKFIGNIDLENIKNKNGASIKKQLAKTLKENGIQYNHRKKIIVSDKFKIIYFGYKYLGADDKAGKNYTGQEVIDSFYSIA